MTKLLDLITGINLPTEFSNVPTTPLECDKGANFNRVERKTSLAVTCPMLFFERKNKQKH